MRADIFLTEGDYAKSREAAKRLIISGAVRIDGKLILKPSESVGDGEHTVSIEQTEKFVSRGGLKLEGALDTFGISVAGMTSVDIGASTGGFTDCLLQRGAIHVFAADSGHGQLDGRIARDARVTVIEGFNARRLCDGETGGIAPEQDIVVMDVSFISQTLIISGLPNILREGGIFISLIKPQFEAGRSAVGKGGIVRSSRDRAAAINRVIECAAAVGFGCFGLMTSPITGGDGNTEYLAFFKFKEQSRIPSAGEILKITEGSRQWIP